MLCCVPKRPTDGGPFHDESPFHDEGPFHDEVANTPSVRKIRIQPYSEEDAPPSILLPCAICARTFMPQSLEKHARICERAATKKRKPFDSAKQRIQGTELAEFRPKQDTRRHHQDERTARSTWKKTHDDFLRTIREARGEVVMDSHKQCNSLITSGAPTRANEKGTCPTCNRQFGIKAYDRHVAWCKERITRMPVSPATNLAKERLEARMRYRAPALKNRRAINREKYSPSSTVNQSAKISLSSPALVKTKESVPVTNCNRESPIKQKPAVVRRPGQPKESPTSGPMKSRLADRSNRPIEDHDLVTSISRRSSHLSSRRALHFPVPPARSRVNDPVCSSEIVSPIASSKQFDGNETISQRVQNDEVKNREAYSAKAQKNVVSARSQGHPKVNDTAVNEKTPGMTVQPCRIRADTQKDNQLVTWKQISHRKDNLQINNPVVSLDFSQESQLLHFDRRCDRRGEIDTLEKENRIKGDSLITKNDITEADELKNTEADKVRDDDIMWLQSIQNLNQTYLIKDSEDIESSEMLHSKWRLIAHCPRVEFYFEDREDEIYEFEYEKSREESIEEKIQIAGQIEELKMDIEDKEDDKIKVTRHTEELKMDSEDRKNDWKVSDKKTKVTGREIGKLSIDIEDKDNNQELIDEQIKVTGHNVKNVEVNIKDKKENQKMNYADVEMDELSVDKGDKINRQIAIDERIVDIIKYTEIKEVGQNSFESDQHIETSIVHSATQNTPKEYEESCFKELKTDYTDNNNYFILDKESSNSEHQYPTLYLDNRNNLTSSDDFIDQDYSNFKDETLQDETNMYSNSLLQLNESTITIVSDRSDKNNKSLNSCDDQTNYSLSPGYKMLPCENNIHPNLLDLTENIQKLSSSVSCRIINPQRNFAKNLEEIEIDERRYENDLITHHSKKSEENLNILNSEVSLLQNSENITDNYLNTHTNSVSLQVRVNEQDQGKFFNSDNFEIIEDEVINGKTDVNADLDSCSNDKSSFVDHSMIKTEVTTGEGLRNNMKSEFDYGSDNTTCVGEHNTRGVNDLESSVTLKDNVEELRYYREKTFLEPRVNILKRASSSTRRIVRERPVNSVEMKHRIRENMNLLRGSTDSLISSIKFVEFANIRRPDTNCTYERETIEIIRPSRKSKMFRGLPDIKSDSTRTKEDSERSYWERASKISRSKFIGLDPSHAGYKFVKRNPRVRILSPVPHSSLINRRKFDLDIRPAWCNYVRRRPDFNLVLKARTGTCKDYDPFLLAEQQMNDLLSDTSDQSTTGSPKLQQTRDTLYPLSHSSAFVKYPPCDKRSSLIAPPFEFDDLASDFSSDSTETNSISREVFLKPDLASKDTTDFAGSRPVKELGRRVIIDKSKALGVDERRAVVGSADRPRKIFDKFAPKIARPLINRSDSIRASSAPRINSDVEKRTSGDIGRIQGSKIAESQRSSDQSLNQRNNNYSSLSGSNLSLSSIVSSSEPDVKRSNSMFDELLTSFEENAFPDLRTFLTNESFDLFSPGGDRQRNGSLNSDEELSSPDSYKPQNHSKLSNDSAYSSLNRKYSHHGRSTNDVVGRLDEDPGDRTSPIQTTTKCKMSKFCHECGQRFPETAKFCCECGVRRLAL